MASARIALSVEQVSKSYPQHTFWRHGRPVRPALRDVTFQVAEGEMLGLLGPNGAGKTTLLKIIATLLYPSTGRVLAYGCDVFKDPRAVRGMMGLVTSDERSFYWRLTGRQNLAFFAALYGIFGRQANERVDTLLTILGLSEAAGRPFHTYSSGMKQKLAIARGLLSEPRIVLYDEPTRSLDPLSATRIRQWILDARKQFQNQVHVIATNQLAEAEQLCDRVLIFNRGSMIACGSISEVRERWRRRDYTVHNLVYRGSGLNGRFRPDANLGLFEISEEEIGANRKLRLRVAKSSNALSLVLAALLHSGATVIQCETEQVPFDEVFCSLVLEEEVLQPR